MTITDLVLSTADRPWQRDPAAVSGGVRVALEFDGTADQVIRGFGGCVNELGHRALAQLSAADRETVLDLLFGPEADGLRFTVARVPVGASDYATSWYSHNETPGDFEMRAFGIERDRSALLPYLLSARRRVPGLRVVASPWSPPTWLKTPPVYNHGTLVADARHRDAYALYLARFTEAYAGEGVPVGELHVQNEPGADQKFPSCVWTARAMADFVGGHLGPAFRERGVDTEIWVGTINDDAIATTATDWRDHAFACLVDPRAAPFVRGVSMQWAGRANIAALHRAFPDLPLTQSESECGDGTNTWQYAMYVNELFRHYLSNGVGTYLSWNMVLAEGGLSTWGWAQNSLVTVAGGTFTVQPEFWVTKHYAHFVRPGARRLELRGPWSARSVAFENPGGGRVVVTGNPLDTAVTVELGTDTVTLPPSSVATVLL
ncbi:glycoside hydrolase family 30 beta sandwich domain-containing protein [Dactylosporangium sp. NPDC000521]|uniref:glycoside hydrolase family 30 protein n=1 Tax=Dactylosporangium sp. NPDC000521 TaxID=3363975 RepID=UPI0036994F48